MYFVRFLADFLNTKCKLPHLCPENRECCKRDGDLCGNLNMSLFNPRWKPYYYYYYYTKAGGAHKRGSPTGDKSQGQRQILNKDAPGPQAVCSSHRLVWRRDNRSYSRRHCSNRRGNHRQGSTAMEQEEICCWVQDPGQKWQHQHTVNECEVI